MNSHSSLTAPQLVEILSLSKDATAVYTTEDLIIEMANDTMIGYWGKDRSVIGRSFIEAVPELIGQPFFGLLKEVLRTGIPYEAKDTAAQLRVNGELEWSYYDFIYRPIKNDRGETYCILHTATDVTERHISRLTIEESYGREQNLTEELKASNEELAAANKEILSTNEELSQSRQDLLDLNTQLEKRVIYRTDELRKAQAEAEMQRDRVTRFFMQAPAGICILDGPELVFELINPLYQQLFPGRLLLGKPLLEAVPEVKGQPIWDILQGVYTTGKTFEGNELLIPLARTADGPVEDRYFNFIYQARETENGRIDGILVFVIEVTDTVMAKKAVEERETDLRSMVMNSHYGLMILKGSDWQIEIVNQQIAALWQKELPEITGKKLMEVLPELKGQPFPDLLARVYDTGIGYGQEEQVLYLESTAGPVEKYVSFYYDPMLNNAGLTTGVIVACEDVTEKVKAKRLLEVSVIEQQSVNEELSAANEELATTNEELVMMQEQLQNETTEKQQAIERLHANEQNIRNMVRQAPVGMCIVQGDPLYVVEINDSFLEIIGKTRQAFQDIPYWEVIAEAAAIYQPITDHVLATGETYHANEHEILLVRNGIAEMVHVDFVYEPMRDGEGKPYAIMIVAIDITDKVLARKRVERAQEQLRMAIDAAELGAYHINTTDRIFHPSPRLKEFFGFGPDEEVPYEAAINQIHEDYRQAAADLVEAAITRGVRFDMEYPVVGYHDGKIRWVRGIGEVQHDTDGKSYFTGVLHEITEKKQDEMRKNDFIGMVSHELKTPLTSLTAILQVLNAKLKKSEDAFVPSALEKANQQVKKMTGMINGFLNISRLESGKIIIDKQTFLMGDLVKEVIEETNLIGIAHIIELQSCDKVIVNADRDKIGSVISNLLSNAVKYSPKGSRIHVSCQKFEKEVWISVKDEGMGIRPEDREKVFDRFYRIVNNYTRHISGFGIGLYLSAEIIHRHNGRVWLESETGKGSTFYFSLPLKAS